MKNQKIGLLIFWIAVVYLLVFGWLINWWVVPMYKFGTPDEINHSIWKPEGVLFWIWAFAPMIGAFMAAIGKIHQVESKKTWVTILVTVFILLISVFPKVMQFHVWAFGTIGLMISILFLATVWFWGRNHSRLENKPKTASIFQLLSLMFFFAASISLCGLLGSPWQTDPGLFFPEKVIEAGTLTSKYSGGIKIGLFLVIGFLFNFLNTFKTNPEIK